ncbi:Ribose import ATP-binding protein RbsA [subsurface metagenome]
MENDILIKTINLSKQFPGVLALDNINFELNKGEIHAIVGENGAGKSTLINIIGGIIPPTEGIIEFESERFYRLTPPIAKKLGISIIHQESEIAPTLNVAENIYLGRYPVNKFGFINYKKMLKDATALMEKVGASIKVGTLIRDLSMTQRRLVELARALSMDVKLLIMDEPTKSFTDEEIKNLFEIVRILKTRGVTVIFISHNLNEIYSISDRVSVLRDGKLINTVLVQEATEEKLIKWMVGKDFNRFISTREKNIGSEVFSLENITKKGILENISFSVKNGEIIGLAGLTGSGRSAVANVMFGLMNPDSGKLMLNGKEIKIKTPNDAIKNGIGFVTEDRNIDGLLLKKTIRENITLANLGIFSRFSFIDHRSEKSESLKFIKLMNIKAISPEQIVMNLSGGNRQKVVFARWLLTKTKVLILDEPTVGIDIGAKQEIYRLISDLAKSGCSIIFISSEISELIRICDRIFAMRSGKIVHEFLQKDVSQEEIIYYCAGFYEKSNTKN